MQQAFYHQRHQIQVLRITAHQADLDNPPAFGCNLIIFTDIITTDKVNNHIHALPAGQFRNHLCKILFTIINDVIGSQLPGKLCFFTAADGGVYRGTKGFRQHDRHTADTGGAAVDKHTLFTLQFAGLEDIRPYGEKIFRNGCRFGVTQVFQRQRDAVVNQAIFRISPARNQRTYFIADLTAFAVFPDSHNFTGDFQSRNRGRIRRRRVTALTLEDVRPVNTGSGHFNQQVFSLYLRQRHLNRL